MLITKEISIDLQDRSVPQIVSAVQYDSCTRAVKITLTDAGSAWSVPSGAKAAVSYRKPDGTSGLYDALPDKSAATTISGSTVTAIFAPQMLTVAGCLDASVVLYQGSQQLATFPFEVQVARNPGAAGEVSNDYYTYATIPALNEAIGNLENLNTTNKTNLVAAINEAYAGGGGSGGGGGVSPSAKVEETETGAKITITDASGTTVAEISDGKTPVKGEDYYTEADKEELVAAVIEALPKYDGEVEE